jgi:hypothetical protein
LTRTSPCEVDRLTRSLADFAKLVELFGDAKKRAYMLADNKLTLNAEWDLDRLAIEIAELRESDFDISLIGFNESEIDELLKADDGDAVQTGAGALAERFMLPPFSVLNACGGWWHGRKAAWLALGIQSELGRGDNSAPGGAPIPLDRAKPTAEPGGSKMPAADYRKTHARGDGGGGRSTRKANAMPAGGGGGGWAKTDATMPRIEPPANGSSTRPPGGQNQR